MLNLKRLKQDKREAELAYQRAVNQSIQLQGIINYLQQQIDKTEKRGDKNDTSI